MMVDFGEDLGPPDMASRESAIDILDAIEAVSINGLEPNSLDIKTISDSFETVMNAQR